MNAQKTVKFLSLKHQQKVIRSEVEKAFLTSLDRSFYILGPSLANFESEYAAYSGSRYCVGVGNGLDALTISLRALDLTPNDEVIVPANTYHATWLAVANTGATIIPVEPDEKSYNLDAVKVGNAITKRTKVILPVHLYGQPCNMTELSGLAKEAGVQIIEDNAQAHGARWMDKKTGSWGVINATSFYPTKNLGALGDGGAITTNDESLAEFARTMRNYGSATKNSADRLGINSRLDEIQAAFLSVKLKHLDNWNRERRLIAEKYNDRLRAAGDLQPPFSDPKAYHVYHLYVVRTDRRDELKTFLSDRGIETMIHYPKPPHLQKAYHHLGFRKGSFPIAEALADSVLSLPLWVGMKDEDIDYVTETIKQFYR